ncbi:MAG: polymerase ECF-subfamily sigma-70 factor [Verrucomicrobiaceae bacterium]|nr:polymerase ECF-subfamily sigma-70 factor [Verrucomicrobiaceae bacterium]
MSDAKAILFDGNSIPADVVDQAVDWAVKLNFNAASASHRDAFSEWLKASAINAEAWRRVQALQSDFAKVPPRLAIDALQNAALNRSDATLSRRRALQMLGLVGVAAAAGWGACRQAPWQRLLADVSTRVGEQRRVRLDDGTELVLNTDSAISADLRGERRLIAVRRGEIQVTTGADNHASASRPFWLSTPFEAERSLLAALVHHYDELIDYVRRHFGDRGFARDIVHDVCVQIMERTEQTGVRIPLALLRRISHDKAVDRCRGEATRRRWIDVVDTLPDAVCPSSDLLRGLTAEQELELLTRAIEALPLRRRQVFILNKIHQLPQADVAARLGISVKMVEKQLRLAMLHCRESFEGEELGYVRFAK